MARFIECLLFQDYHLLDNKSRLLESKTNT